MNENKRQHTNEMNSKEQVSQSKPGNRQRKENVSAQKDGFRYDYNDSSDF